MTVTSVLTHSVSRVGLSILLMQEPRPGLDLLRMMSYLILTLKEGENFIRKDPTYPAWAEGPGPTLPTQPGNAGSLRVHVTCHVTAH